MNQQDLCLPPGVPLYEMDMEVKWGDMDALSHVNNAQYFRNGFTIRNKVCWAIRETGLLLLITTQNI